MAHVCLIIIIAVIAESISLQQSRVVIYEVSKAQASVQEVAKAIIKMITSKMSRSIEETIYC